jgi:hypothetical protein
MGKGVNHDRDEDHVFVVEFANDFVAMDRWGGVAVAGLLMRPSLHHSCI